MKERLQGVLAGALIGALCVSGVAIAKSRTENIEVTYDNIKVYKDNVLCELKDSNGSVIEPFIYNGTTYMPVRGVASAMGADVTWDGNTKSVYIWDKMVAGNTFLLDVCEPYDEDYCDIYTSGKTFKMDGKSYSNGLCFSYNWSSGYALFNLDGRFNSLSFDIGHCGNVSEEKDITFIVDGREVKTITLEPEQLAEHVTIPLNYGLQMKIKSYRYVGIANMVVE